MKKQLKRILAGILVVVMIVTTLAGCGNNTSGSLSDSSQSGSLTSGSSSDVETEWEYQEDTSPYEFTAWWPSVWMGKDSIEAGYYDSDVVEYIKEQTGVTMYVDCPAGDESELASVMIAAGTFPEVVVFGSYNSIYLQQMIDAGQVLPFSDLMDEHCPKMWDLIPESVKTYHTSDDGKLWAFTGFTYDGNWGEEAKALGSVSVELPHGNNVMYIRQDILNAYGKEDITDLDEYTAFLHWVKDNYPDVEPVSSTSGSPRGGFFVHLKSTFGCHLSDTYPQEDGSIKYYIYDPHYVDYLKWMNGLYKDGIITKNVLTEDQASIDTKVYSASYASMINAIWNMDGTLGQSIKDAYGEDTDKIYVDCGPIQKKGIEWKVQMGVDKGGQTTVITTNADKPDRIIKYFEFLFTEQGQLTMMAGIEGETWNRNADGTLSYAQDFIDVAKNGGYEQLTNTYKVVGLWSPWIVRGGTWEGVLGGLTQDAEQSAEKAEKTNKRLNDWTVNIWDEGYSNISECIETGSDLDVLRSKIEEVCNKAGMEMIIADDDATFDKLYQDCLAEIEQMGVAQIEEAYTQEHKEQCEKLGIEP